MKKIYLLISFTAACLFSFPAESKSCGIKLESMSQTSGSPGQTFDLIGSWGDSQGTKLPCINKGGRNVLEVVAWSERVVRVRIPGHLTAGDYRVGMYCSDPYKGRTTGTTWRTFTVTGQPVSPPPVKTQATTPAPATSKPSPPPSKKSSPIAAFDSIKRIGVIVIVLYIVFMWIRKKTQLSTATEGISPAMHGNPTGVVQGVPYKAESYDAVTTTIWIDLNRKLTKPLEINARDGRPATIDLSVKHEVNALLDQGANYIDIGFNTNRIAADFPNCQKIDDFDWLESMAALLIRLRNLAV